MHMYIHTHIHARACVCVCAQACLRNVNDHGAPLRRVIIHNNNYKNWST